MEDLRNDAQPLARLGTTGDEGADLAMVPRTGRQPMDPDVGVDRQDPQTTSSSEAPGPGAGAPNISS